MAIYQSTGGPTAMRGTAADDTYLVRNTGDTVSEDPNGGYDVVIATVSYTRPANVEALAVVGGGLTATGTSGSDLLFSLQGGANTLVGLGGDDTYVVNNVGDVVTEPANGGFDTVYATVNFTIPANVEVLVARGSGLTATGSAGADILYSVDGANILVGGAGDDTYVVNNAGDRVIEAGGGGYDTVYAQVSYTIPANVEALTVRGSGLTARGSAGTDVLTSLGGPNILRGNGGADTFYVNNVGDQIVADFGSKVYTTVDFSAPSGVAVLIAQGSGLTVRGGSSTTTLISLGGPNTLVATAPQNITIYVNNSGDVINSTEPGELYTSVDYTVPATYGGNRFHVTGPGVLSISALSRVAVVDVQSDRATVIGTSAGDYFYDNGHSGVTFVSGSTQRPYSNEYYVGNSGTVIKEVASIGSLVFASVNFVCPQNIKTLTMTADGTTGYAPSGGGSALVAQALNVTLIGSDGIDFFGTDRDNTTIQGGGGADVINLFGNHPSLIIYKNLNDSLNQNGKCDVIYGVGANTKIDISAVVGGGYQITLGGIEFAPDGTGAYQGLIAIQTSGSYKLTASNFITTPPALAETHGTDAAPLIGWDVRPHGAGGLL